MVEPTDNEKKLLREIHHRIKNHLQVINSLFELQMMDLPDEQAKSTLAEASGRLGVISVVYKNLSVSDLYSTVDFEKVVIEIFHQMSHSTIKIESATRPFIQIPDLFLDVETAIPLGLIMNELFMNSFTSKAKSESERKISVQLKKNSENDYCIEFFDSGVQLPVKFDLNDRNLPLGMRLVAGLSRQVRGRAEYTNAEGTWFKIFFSKS